MIAGKNLTGMLNKIDSFDMTLRPYSAIVLALAGLLLAGMGVYFIFLRSSLLSEDLIYMGSTLENVKMNLPGLLNWLPKVFWVMGGYIFTSGLLTVFISFTAYRKRTNCAFGIVALAGISSIGLMTMVNFMIDSDFKWLLFSFMLLWVSSLVLYLLRQ